MRQDIRSYWWFKGLTLLVTVACAVAVACALNGKTGSQVDVELLGGVLNIRWDRENDRVYMTGPAVEVYHGEIGLKENNV